MIYKKYLTELLQEVRHAGDKAMEIFRGDFSVEIKEDESPVTLADYEVDKILTAFIHSIDNSPIISEEASLPEFDERQRWESFWIMDPIDGTKEFIKKKNEFTINLAYVVNSKVCFGIVYAPALEEMYWGGEGIGSYREIQGKREPLKWSAKTLDEYYEESVRIFGSVSHPEEELEDFKTRFKDVQLVSVGSSLKFCRLAFGDGDIYPRFIQLNEWDIAAGHAVVKYSGKNVFYLNTTDEVLYNSESLKAPLFIAY